jgi:hypothetical protein
MQTPTKGKATPIKPKSTKKDDMVFDTPPPKTTATNALQKKLQAVAKDKSTPNGIKTPKSISVNGTPTKSKGKVSTSKVKPPSHLELEKIKAQVLGKLCGRIPIPLIGDLVETTKYLALQLI